MKRLLIFLALCGGLSCNRNAGGPSAGIITVSIAPFKYFVEEIGGNDFSVNVMVPAGSNPHVYEPYPAQVNNLRKSVAYISDGSLGFEITWLDRFYSMNGSMMKLSLGDKIDLINPSAGHKKVDSAKGDPHFWVSPVSALIIASEIKDLLCGLNPPQAKKYKKNYSVLAGKIKETDAKARLLFSDFRGRSFMIYHPDLAYFARDYNLREVPVEAEGKEPPPKRLMELIDTGRIEKMRTLFVQKEFDSKNAREIARETGGRICVIDPLSEDWLKSVNDIIDDLYRSFKEP
ncbi:MAG: zinc ABC transporter substrate-binding protein [Bacteroidales bacterium]|jgi:zinc transport system substrate-binding protein